MSRFSVVVVNWNSREDTAACLRSLRAQTDRGFEVIVVDNGSHDGSVDMLRRDFPEVTLVDAGANLGFAEGVNRGIEVATGAWIATLNNDAEARPGWIAALRAAVEAGGPRLGMLQSQIVFSARPGHVNSTGIIVLRSGYARDREFDAPVRVADGTEDIFCPTAGAALYRREMLDEVKLPSGWFDRDFFMYAEDVDLGWRCRLAGWHARYVPGAVVHHVFQGSSKKKGARFVELQCKKNRLRVLLKNGSPGMLLRTLGTTVVSVAQVSAWSRLRAVPELVKAVREAAAQRAMVGRLCRVDRARLESDWIGREG